MLWGGCWWDPNLLYRMIFRYSHPTLKLWDGLYHEIHNEPEKAAVFKLMIEWIEKHLK